MYCIVLIWVAFVVHNILDLLLIFLKHLFPSFQMTAVLFKWVWNYSNFPLRFQVRKCTRKVGIFVSALLFPGSVLKQWYRSRSSHGSNKQWKIEFSSSSSAMFLLCSMAIRKGEAGEPVVTLGFVRLNLCAKICILHYQKIFLEIILIIPELLIKLKKK